MRTFLGTALVVLVVLAAGCGGGGGGGTTGGKQSGEAAKPATQILADATKAASAASSVHMSGQVTSGGDSIGIDLSAVKGKGATGSMTFKGVKIDLVVVGGKGYLHAGSDFWKQFAGSSGGTIAQLLNGKWLEFPATDAQFGSLTGVTDANSIFSSLKSSHGKLVNKGTTTYKGQSVIEIVDTTKGGTLYVAASGTPYPVAVVGSDASSSGGITFDRWNESVALTAPAGAIDVSQLGH